MTTQTQTHRFALFALAAGAFAIGTTEFSPMGFLPEIANGLEISISQAGLLITAYAVGVMVGAPLMTLAFNRFNRRLALMLLMVLFTVGNLLSAIAPEFFTLTLARLVTSLNHGAFFGIGSVVAAQLVPKEKQASAVAAMFMGLTIANIGGVPFATWFGQHFGWRTAFACIALLGVITMLSLARALPPMAAAPVTNIRAELAVLTRRPVLLAMATTVMGAGAMFSLYTYIAPSLQTFTQASSGLITVMLVLVGIGFSIGNYVGGRWADKSIDKTLVIFLVLLAAVMFVFPLFAATAYGAGIALVIWGTAAFAIVAPLQMRVMSVAHEAAGLASAVNIGAFNLGNALGAAVGSLILYLGGSYTAVSVGGAVMALLALVLVWVQRRDRTAQAAELASLA